jgi:hypothetical protein
VEVILHNLDNISTKSLFQVHTPPTKKVFSRIDDVQGAHVIQLVCLENVKKKHFRLLNKEINAREVPKVWGAPYAGP